MNKTQASALNDIYDYFINSQDFNGIPLRQIGEDLGISYEETIDIVIQLVSDDYCMIQSSTNPHIIRSNTYSISSQIKCLESAKEIKGEESLSEHINLITENTDFPICVYPSQTYLIHHREVSSMPYFTQKLSLGIPQLTPCFFDMDVLQRYYDDPRYYFRFESYSGRISYREQDGVSLVRKEDEAFLETFGLGYDNQGQRIVVAYLRYLNDLTAQHQSYWQSKMVHPSRNPRILQEYYDNTEGQWATSESVYVAFMHELNTIISLSEQIFGKALFRKKISIDCPPKELSFFLIPSKIHFFDFILVMDQLLSENINRDFFAGKVELESEKEREDGKIVVTSKGTLSLLCEWLNTSVILTKGSVEDLIKPLKTIRKLRQTRAHDLIKDEFRPEYFEEQKNIIWESYSSLHNLRVLLVGHPKANKSLVPDWLDSVEIKNY